MNEEKTMVEAAVAEKEKKMRKKTEKKKSC